MARVNTAHSIVLRTRFDSYGKGLGWAVAVGLAIGLASGAQGQASGQGNGGGPPPVPGLEGADFRIKEASLRYEGTFISRKVGSMVTLRPGDRAVVFQPERAIGPEDARGVGVGGRAERPMILIPGAHLERLEDLAATREATTLYSLTGQVFVYRGMNYLLLSVPPMLASASETGAAGQGLGVDAEATPTLKPATEKQSDEQAATPEIGASEEEADGRGATGISLEGKPESVEAIISQLEQVRQGQRTLSRTGSGGEESEAAVRGSESAGALRPSSAGLSNVPAPIAEGKLISRRTGRFVRESGSAGPGGTGREEEGGPTGENAGGGRWALALEGDADSPAPAPMTLVPCAALERLESIAGVLGPGMQVQVSGRVLAYRGQNYLLATMVRLTTPTELKPRQ